jgi:hypothetical protein
MYSIWSQFGLVCITTSYGLDGHSSIPGKGKISSGAHLFFCLMDTGVLEARLKWSGLEDDCAPPSSVEIKDGVTHPLPRISSRSGF